MTCKKDEFVFHFLNFPLLEPWIKRPLEEAVGARSLPFWVSVSFLGFWVCALLLLPPLSTVLVFSCVCGRSLLL